jgi:hypothetical protein
MTRIAEIDRIEIKVSDLKTSHLFNEDTLKFLGFRVFDEYDNALGRTKQLRTGQRAAARARSVRRRRLPK